MRRTPLPALLLALLLAAGCAEQDLGPDAPVDPARPTEGSPDDARIRLELFVQGFDKPLQFVDDGSGRSFVVEQGGLVHVLRDGHRLSAPFLDLRGQLAGGFEQGLLSIAFPPQPDGRVYVSYTSTDGTSVLARYHVRADDPDRLDAESEERILTVEQPFANHNGGLALFGPDGYLYFGLGDGGSGNDPLGHAQNVRTLLGTILRLDVSGATGYTAPADNPFVGQDGRDEIWHYGLRNPWRFTFDRETDALYIADVGQNRIEEVNVAPAGEAGLDFGWPVWEGSRRNQAGETRGEPVFPVAEYAQEDTGGCSVTGGHVYRGEAVPELVGAYLYGDYCSGTIWSLWQDAEGEWTTRRLLDADLSISSFAQAAGELYVIDHGGSIHRILAQDP